MISKFASMAKLPLETYEGVDLDPAKWVNAKSVQEASEKLGVGSKQLQELADLQLVPHYRISGGPPRFAMQPLRDWIAANLVETYLGKFLPTQEVETITVERPRSIPPELRGIRGLTIAGPLCRWPGIYFLTDEDEIVYVGKADEVCKRCGAHTDKIYTGAFSVPCHESALCQVESDYIKAFLPKYNRCSVALSAKRKRDHALAEKNSL